MSLTNTVDALNASLNTLKNSSIRYSVSLINGWVGNLVVAADKMSGMGTLSGYINGDNATDVYFANASIKPSVAYLNKQFPVPTQATPMPILDGDFIYFVHNDDAWAVKAPEFGQGKTYQFNVGFNFASIL